MAFRYKRITDAGNLPVTHGPSTLGTVNIGTGDTTAVFTIYDGTSDSGNIVAVLDATTKSSHGYLTFCPNGIYCVLSGGDADITVAHT
jgi:hypothetical protein